MSADLKDNLWNGLGACLKAVAGYINDERNSPVGRVNLAAAITLGVFATALFVPNVALGIARLFATHAPPPWFYALPFLAYMVVAIILIASLAMISKKPPI